MTFDNDAFLPILPVMGVPEINLTEDKRCLMSKIASGISLFTIPFNLCMLTVAIYIEIAVQDKIGLIEGSRNALPGFMIMLSIFGLITNILGARVCWVIHDIKRRDDWKKYLKIFVIISVILFVCVFVTSVLCFTSIASLRKLFSKGIITSMKKYSTDMPKKHIIDLLQTQYECCGSRGYTDWFDVKLVSKKYITDDYMTKEEQNVYRKHNDNVPFSCCKLRTLRPCINTRVHEKHFKYQYNKDLTLFTRGCGDALMTSYKQILNVAGGVIIVLALAELAIGLLTRLLQTSFENLNEDEDSTAYLFPFGGHAKPSEDNELDNELQNLLEDDLPPPPTLESLQNLESLPPVSSLDNISVTESFDDDDDDEQFPVLPEEVLSYDEDALPPPRQSFKYVNQM